MTINLPTPQGFLSAPNGNKSMIRLILVIAVVVGVLFLFAAAAAMLWIAVYKPDALTQLGLTFTGFGGGWAFLTGKLAKWKAVQLQWEQHPPIPVVNDPPAPPAAEAYTASEVVDAPVAVAAPKAAPVVDIPAVQEPAPFPLAATALLAVPIVEPSPIPQAAIDFILEQEGIDQPYLWPTGESGITIGYGYDLGYEMHFVRDWTNVIPDVWLHALVGALGKKGEDAHALAAHFRGMTITASMASRVFHAATLPQELASARKAMPGFDAAPPLIRGSILSLGYNRGWGLKDEHGSKTREGMRRIAAALVAGEYDKIPGCFREQASLWPEGSGLHKRRLAEADLAQDGLRDLAA